MGFGRLWFVLFAALRTSLFVLTESNDRIIGMGAEFEALLPSGVAPVSAPL